METLHVAIVMATYNGESYVEEQLLSLVEQTRQPDSLLISDDGSSDATWDILQTFAAAAPFPVRLIQQDQRLGAQQNFARSLEQAEGDLLLFCDQDDRWHRDKIESVVAVFRDQRVGMVLNDAVLTDSRLRPVGRTLFEQHHLGEGDFGLIRDGRAFKVFARRMQPYGSTTALRTAVAKACLPLPEGQSYDQWIGQLAALTAPVAVIRRPLQDYRQHSMQVTGIQEGSRIVQAFRRRRLHNRSELDRDVRQLQQLQQHLMRLDRPSGPVAEALALTTGRLELERRRQRIRTQLLLRPVAVAALLASGAYHRHARGFRSAGLDLLAAR